VALNTIDVNRAGVWMNLFPHALRLMTHLETQIRHPTWTFGGGTVLMLRIGHRQSKDIDLFVPDSQYLGYINPRLSDVAEGVSTDYEENSEFIKLFLPEGEINVVVGESLTDDPYQTAMCMGRPVKFETCAEIIAKKMWHRGNQAKARDLFDLCAVATKEPDAIDVAAPFMKKHGAAFLQRLELRADLAEAEFNAIDTLEFRPTFAESMVLAAAIIEPLISS
jgi:predicted nucleotidyltransferase component of viral defense system